MNNTQKTNILITGAGGPAAICAFKSLSKENFNIHMADMDRLSAGLYLVSQSNRHVIPSASDKYFVTELLHLCIKNDIDVLIPTVDVELHQLAKTRKRFKQKGIKVLVTKSEILKTIMNKFDLLSRVRQEVSVGQFDLLKNANGDHWEDKKIVVKPVSGSGSRGVNFYDSFKQIPNQKFTQNDLMIQEFITGPEYSVDVMVGKNGNVKAAVPRIRMRTDSGVSVTGRVENNLSIINYVEKIINTLGLTYMANIQVIDSPKYGPVLIEINPRFSGGLSLVIEAGANTPLMAVNEILGRKVKKIKSFKEIAMVRTYNETFIDPKQLDRA